MHSCKHLNFINIEDGKKDGHVKIVLQDTISTPAPLIFGRNSKGIVTDASAKPIRAPSIAGGLPND